MKRPKVTGGDGRFDIPPHKGQDAATNSVIWGKNQQKRICQKAGHSLPTTCVRAVFLLLITWLIWFYLQSVFLWALPSVHWFTLSGLLSFSLHTVTYTQICFKPRNVSCLDKHRIPHIKALTFTRIYFFTIHFHANSVPAKTVRHRKSNYLWF